MKWNDKPNWEDRLWSVKLLFNTLGNILGIIFIVIAILVWLGYFGIIRQGVSEDSCTPNYMGSCDP